MVNAYGHGHVRTPMCIKHLACLLALLLGLLSITSISMCIRTASLITILVILNRIIEFSLLNLLCRRLMVIRLLLHTLHPRAQQHGAAV